MTGYREPSPPEKYIKIQSNFVLAEFYFLTSILFLLLLNGLTTTAIWVSRGEVLLHPLGFMTTLLFCVLLIVSVRGMYFRPVISYYPEAGKLLISQNGRVIFIGRMSAPRSCDWLWVPWPPMRVLSFPLLPEDYKTLRRSISWLSLGDGLWPLKGRLFVVWPLFVRSKI